MTYSSPLLRQQLRDLAREALPDLPWVDDVQGSSVRFGDLLLHLFAGGGAVGDSHVWLSLTVAREEEPIYKWRHVYHRTLRRGYGLTAAQGGVNPDAPLGDPFDYLRGCLREAYQIAQEHPEYKPPEMEEERVAPVDPPDQRLRARARRRAAAGARRLFAAGTRRLLEAL